MSLRRVDLKMYNKFFSIIKPGPPPPNVGEQEKITQLQNQAKMWQEQKRLEEEQERLKKQQEEQLLKKLAETMPGTKS